MNPACSDCPIRKHKFGCGWLNAKTDCQHRDHKNDWRKYNEAKRNKSNRKTEVRG